MLLIVLFGSVEIVGLTVIINVSHVKVTDSFMAINKTV